MAEFYAIALTYTREDCISTIPARLSRGMRHTYQALCYEGKITEWFQTSSLVYQAFPRHGCDSLFDSGIRSAKSVNDIGMLQIRIARVVKAT